MKVKIIGKQVLILLLIWRGVAMLLSKFVFIIFLR